MKRSSLVSLALVAVLFFSALLPATVADAYGSPDYGQYCTELTKTFIQGETINLSGTYIFAMVDKQALDSSGSSTVEAAVLTNYGNFKLALVPAELVREPNASLRLSSAVVDGMLWNAITYDLYYGVERYSLVNNGVYLNIDGNTGILQLDNDGYRTRWKMTTLSDKYPTLEYAIDKSLYYLSSAGLLMPTSTVVLETLSATQNKEDSLVFILLEAEPEAIEETKSLTIPALAVVPEQTTSPTYPDSSSQMVWIPTNGGHKYHSKSSCSGMINPEYVSIEEAIQRGYTRCKRCW